ncbi:MAG: hypothetical protein WBQ25_22865 [Nitrososphaeraceae archaeon]
MRRHQSDRVDWHTASHITDPDEIFKMFTEHKFGKKTNTSSNNKNRNRSRVKSASILTSASPSSQPWIPRLIAYWSHDCHEKGIAEYNEKAYYNNQRRRSRLQ